MKIELLVDERERIVESLELRKPEERNTLISDTSLSCASPNLFQVVTVLACSGQLIGKVVQVIL